MAAPATLTALSLREAVADALYRCVRGLDSNDRELYESACVKDESMVLIAGHTTHNGWTAICKAFDIIFTIITTHITSNVRVEVQDGADTAFLTAHAMSHHIRPDDAFKPDDTSYTAASLYTIDLIKDTNDGLWKIKKWHINILWTTGDPAVMRG